MRAQVLRGEFQRCEENNELIHAPTHWAYGHTTANRIYRRKAGLENGQIQLELLSVSRQRFVSRLGLWPGESADCIRPFKLDRLAPCPADPADEERITRLWDAHRPVFGPEPAPNHPARAFWDALKAWEHASFMAEAELAGFVSSAKKPCNNAQLGEIVNHET